MFEIFAVGIFIVIVFCCLVVWDSVQQKDINDALKRIITIKSNIIESQGKTIDTYNDMLSGMRRKRKFEQQYVLEKIKEIRLRYYNQGHNTPNEMWSDMENGVNEIFEISENK